MRKPRVAGGPDVAAGGAGVCEVPFLDGRRDCAKERRRGLCVATLERGARSWARVRRHRDLFAAVDVLVVDKVGFVLLQCVTRVPVVARVLGRSGFRTGVGSSSDSEGDCSAGAFGLLGDCKALIEGGSVLLGSDNLGGNGGGRTRVVGDG